MQFDSEAQSQGVRVRRRDLITGFAVAQLAHGASAQFADYTSDFEVDAQDAEPRVRCFDLRRLVSSRTPADEFFLFHQTKTVSAVDVGTWRLTVTGAVARPITLTYADLLRRPSLEIEATIECSGNSGHSRLMNGLVSNAAWRGPALAPLLRECGVLPEAREVVFFGMDGESERKWAAREQEMYSPHGRSLFVQDALDGNILLATQMNGAPLPPDSGFPVRLVVPGWYGMTQVKWLNRILVLDRRYEGRHMARNYHSIHRGLETSIARARLKSVLARIETFDSTVRLHGAAWSGEEPVTGVDVRIDDGPWRPARLQSADSRWAWRLWSLDWAHPPRRSHRIVCRAQDSRGRVQPDPEEWRGDFRSSREDNSQWTRTVVIS